MQNPQYSRPSRIQPPQQALQTATLKGEMQKDDSGVLGSTTGAPRSVMQEARLPSNTAVTQGNNIPLSLKERQRERERERGEDRRGEGEGREGRGRDRRKVGKTEIELVGRV